MKKAEKNRLEKKERLLNAAEQVFQASGYSATRVDTIAEKAGLTKQTLYRYFESKEMLFKAVLEARKEKLKPDFAEALEDENTEKALTDFAYAFMTWHLSKEHISTMKLTIAEGHLIPEITRWLYTIGPNKTKASLLGFFKERFLIDNVEIPVNSFIGALLYVRMPVLVGIQAVPTDDEIRRYAEKTVSFYIEMLSG